MLEIDLNFINELAHNDLATMVFLLMFKYYLWIPLVLVIFKFIVFPLYIDWRNNKFAAKQSYIYLAIDIPKRNEQSIKGMELVFTQMLGGHGTCTKIEKYWDGWYQLRFSLEIVSIDGYLQFLIRSPKQFRDLVEDSVYAQYPDAEITEVEDYTTSVPDYFPNDTHDLFGIDYILDKEDYYPIRTHELFEHAFAKQYVDPLAGLLEAMSKLGQGEQLWVQFIAKPLPVNWATEGEKFVNDMIGTKMPVKSTIIDKVVGKSFTMMNEASSQMLGLEFVPGEAAPEDKGDPSKVPYMSPGRKSLVEMVEKKIQKAAFGMNIRVIYVAEKDKFVKTRGIHPIIGAIKQFGYLTSYGNGFKPVMKTSTLGPKYFWVSRRVANRQTLYLNAYKGRRTDIGPKDFALNVEEMATIYHFPSMFVKAPMLKKTDIVKTEPPAALPYEISVGAGEEALATEVQEKEVSKNLQPTFDYDNDEFENRFAKDKKLFKSTREQRQKQLDKVAEEDAKKLKELKVKEKQERQHPVRQQKANEKQRSINDNFNSEIGQREDKMQTPSNLPFID